MPGLHDLIQQYGDLLAEEGRISERKEQLRAAIAQEMATQNLRSTSTEFGSAARIWRFKLLPRPEPVLGLLSSEDLLFFAHFTPARVKEVLVPKYGRETLLPLFDIEKSESLVIKRPPGSFRRDPASSRRAVEQKSDGPDPRGTEAPCDPVGHEVGVLNCHTGRRPISAGSNARENAQERFSKQPEESSYLLIY